jgi:uncharacterized protein (DUF779 family)
MEIPNRIEITPEAIGVVEKLKKETGSELIFHLSGGCCDGSAPMCFEKGEFKIGSQDVWLGQIQNCDFFMSRDQFDYWKHTQLTLDVVPGRGSSFSLEIPLGLRFIIHSRLFSEAEYAALLPIKSGADFFS